MRPKRLSYNLLQRQQAVIRISGSYANVKVDKADNKRNDTTLFSEGKQHMAKQEHYCNQCKYYKVITRTGDCEKTGANVEGNSPVCAGHKDFFEPLDTIGNKLRMARVAAGMTREDVEADLGVSWTTVRDWENSARNPPKYVNKLMHMYYESKNK